MRAYNRSSVVITTRLLVEEGMVGECATHEEILEEYDELREAETSAWSLAGDLSARTRNPIYRTWTDFPWASMRDHEANDRYLAAARRLDREFQKHAVPDIRDHGLWKTELEVACAWLRTNAGERTAEFYDRACRAAAAAHLEYEDLRHELDAFWWEHQEVIEAYS